LAGFTNPHTYFSTRNTKQRTRPVSISLGPSSKNLIRRKSRVRIHATVRPYLTRDYV